MRIGRQWRVLGTELLNLGGIHGESDYEHIRDEWVASNKTLQEVCDHDEEAVYDQL